MTYVAPFILIVFMVAAAPKKSAGSTCDAATLQQFHTCGEDLKHLGSFIGLENVLGRPALTDQQRLLKTLFENYEKSLRPVLNITVDVTNITLNPALVSIVRIDEAAESITIVLKFRMLWKDVFLRWNPSDYGGIQQLRIPSNLIWIPDIYTTNMISGTKLISDEHNLVVIGFDGAIFISVVQILTMSCIYDIFIFPFDIQNCTMIVQSHIYQEKEINIIDVIAADLGSYNENAEWNLISMTGRRSMKIVPILSATPMILADYDIIIQRKPIYFVLTFIVPCFMITATTIIGIFSPFSDAGDREEKVTMGLTSVLAMAVILTVIAQEMPKSSQGMPLLGIYVMLQVGIAAVSCLMAAIVMYQHRKWPIGEPVPAWILTITRCFRKERNSEEKKISPQNCYNEYDKDASNDSSLINANKHQTHILKNIQLMIRQMVEHLRDRKEEENFRRNWDAACLALDNLLMVVFLTLHCVLTVGVLTIGYLHLNTETYI